MNLSDFSLLKEDDENYTIGHPKGKAISVPKKGLSDRAQLLISKLKREQHFAEGTEDPIEINPNAQMPSPEEINQAQINLAQNQAGEQPYGLGDTQYATGAPLSPETPNEGIKTPSANDELQSFQNSSEESVGNEPQQSPPAQTLLPQNPGGLQQTRKDIEQAQSQIKGAEEGNETELPEVKPVDEIWKNNQKKDQEFEKAFADNKVDPNRIWHNMSTGSKVSASIGLILGGIGAGLSGGPNTALQMMNNAIDRDIEAQKNDQGKAMTLWKMNREAVGNDMQATLMTQNQLLTAAKFKISQAQATTTNALAQQQLAQAKLGIDQQIATNNWMNSRLTGGAPGSEQQHISELQVMQALRPDFYKDMESKYVPGVGTARVPLSPADKEAFKAYDEMQKAVNDAKAFQSKEVGPLGALPFTATKDIAESKKNAIALAMNKLNGLNRLNETEYDAFQHSIGKLGSFQNERALAQLDELNNQIARKKQSEMKVLGITPFKQSASNQQARAWLAANPNDPQAPQVRQILGMQ
jgi:hypothetical protein